MLFKNIIYPHISFKKLKSNITSLNPDKPVNIIAVSKTFTLNYIKPLIDYGHSHFGENKVQEATAKWSNQKKISDNFKRVHWTNITEAKTKENKWTYDEKHHSFSFLAVLPSRLPSKGFCALDCRRG